MSLVSNIEGSLPVGGEFQGFNGDCVEYSFMVARASAETFRSCDGTELDRLTNESIRFGEASPNGAMTNANLAWLCTQESVPYQQEANSDSNWSWQAWIKAYGGKEPLCMGFSNGQALPGNEQNVFGHCVAVLDYDGLSTVIIANGDSSNGRNGQLDQVSFDQLTAAQPTQVTRLELNIMTALDGYFNQDSPTHWTLKKDPSITLHDGMLQYWQQIGGLIGLPVNNEDYSLGGGVSFQWFERSIQVWDPGHTIDNPNGGPCYLAHIGDPRFKLVTPPAPVTPPVVHVSPDAHVVDNNGIVDVRLTYTVE